MDKSASPPSPPSPALEDMPLEQLPGVTPSDLKRLQALNLQTAAELLLYLPSEWQDRTRLTPIGQLVQGTQAQVQGEVTQVFQPRGRRMLSVRLHDGSGEIELLFFHFSHNQAQRMRNATLRCFGEVKAGRGLARMIHPRYSVLPPGSAAPPLSNHLTPLYSGSGGTAGQKQLQKHIEQCLSLAEQPGALADPVTPLIPKVLPQISLYEALDTLHRMPPEGGDAESTQNLARGRLALDELVADMLGQMQAGQKVRSMPAPPLRGGDDLVAALLESLPFRLTEAQQRVNAEILADMDNSAPMLRLLQGDVGSGKTLVALCAALRAIGSGWQVAFMAPTEVLVEQHLINMRAWLTPLGLDTAALTASSSPGERRSILAALDAGDLKIVVGTHALFEDEVQFKDLGLVIVDEQHRFGVHQRLRLVERGRGLLCPHQLTMTATPIPRTLAMTRYAEMDVSVLDEMPPGRHPVQTTTHSERDRDRIIQRIGERCGEGDRVYWVCAMIDESEQLKARAANLVYEELKAKLPAVRVGLIHGRLKSAEKSAAIEEFKTGEVQLLVATTVIEVGMDVPEATLMVIENPERFGLAQLHQLRGRVGRSERKSFCVLLHGGEMTESAQRRLQVLCQFQDGFSIAEEDLRIRGPGEMLGVRQAGEADYRIFDYLVHQKLLRPAHQIAGDLLRADAKQTDRLQRRWLAHRLDYARV